MANISRPISPHLTIYRPQPTSVLSIFHRITGVVMSLCLVIYVIIAKYISLGISFYDVYLLNFYINNNIDWLVLSALFFIVFSIYYHFGNGIRHLFWDNVNGLDLESIYSTGNILILSSLICTIITWLLFGSL